MFNFIEQFYYGNIEPQACSSELTAQMKKELRELTEKEEALRGKLSDETKAAFEDYVATCTAFTSTCCTDSFMVGFRLGAKFTYGTLLKVRKDDMIMELKKHYTNEQTGISYTLHGYFYLPDLKPAEENITLGKWGMMHKAYLKKHKKALFSTLLMQGKLYQYCAEIEKQARDMFDTLIEQMKESEGVTEELKEHNQWEWIQIMNNIQERANEIVCRELIYA